MPSYRIIDDFTLGDTYKFVRMLDSVPDNQLVTGAFWTVKLSNGGAPEFSINITPVSVGAGEVMNYPDGSVRLNFIATPDVSINMIPNETYLYDVHVNLDSGEKYTLEYGKLFTAPTVLGAH